MKTTKDQLKFDCLPILKTPAQMSKVSGIGENRLRELMDAGKLEFLQNGRKRLLTNDAIIDYYNRNKVNNGGVKEDE